MSSARQIKKLVQPLIARNPDLVLVAGYILCHLPATHFGRYICIENRPSRGYFTVEWWMKHLFEPGRAATLSLGRTFGLAGRSTRYKPKGQGGLFEWDDPTMPGDFVDQVEAEILPLFRSLDTLEKSIAFVGTYPSNPLGQHPPWMTLMHVALGEIESAQALWQPISHQYVKGEIIQYAAGQHIYDLWCELTEPLMAGDRAALARLLHAWEAGNVIGTKLEPHWRSKPFPLETAA